MATGRPTFQSERFRLWITNTANQRGLTLQTLHITDRFHHVRHKPERVIFAGITKRLERYLAKRPHLTFSHPRNHARRVVYMSPGVKVWAKFMPGGYATYPVHNPDVKHLHNGHKIDYMTRNLFRHATDAIGLRARAYAMSWFIYEKFGTRKEPVRWLSIAAGTGQPTFDAAQLFSVMPKFYLTDVNAEILEFAQKLSLSYAIPPENLTFQTLDIGNSAALKKVIRHAEPDVIEMMGLMEYLDDTTAVAVMKQLISLLPKGSVFLFTNMRSDHPELLTHKHAVGWPGVIQRSVDEVMQLIEASGGARTQTTVLLPDDKVYAVYCINTP